MQLSKIVKSFKIIEILLRVLFDFLFLIIRKFLLLWKIENGSITIFSLHKLGDTVFTVPAIRIISNQYGNGNKINLVCFSENIPIYKCVFENINFIGLNRFDFFLGGRIADKKTRKMIKNLKSSTIFDLTGVPAVSFLFNSRAKEIIGINRREFKMLYDVFVDTGVDKYSIDLYLSPIKKKFNVLDDKSFRQFPIKINRGNRILIHPFAAWESKEWNLRKYIELAKLLSNEYDCSIIIQPDSLSKDVADELERMGINYIISHNTSELMNEISKSALLIGNDSGAVYVSGLLGIPTLTIFGPTNPLFCNLGSSYHRTVQKIISCSPKEKEKWCFTNAGTIGCPSFECINLLTVEEVFSQLINMVENLSIKKIHNLVEMNHL